MSYGPRKNRKVKKFDKEGGKPKGPSGRYPPHQPTQETRAAVAAGAASFVSQDLIALQLGIDTKTLRKHYRLELDTAIERANASVVSRLFKHTEKYPVACFYWLQNRDSDRWKHAAQMNHKHDVDGKLGSLADMVLQSYGPKKPEDKG